MRARSFSLNIWHKEAALIPTPILTVLSTFRKNGVQTLLRGGQACVFYGAAQVSEDIDLDLSPLLEGHRQLRHVVQIGAGKWNIRSACEFIEGKVFQEDGSAEAAHREIGRVDEVLTEMYLAFLAHSIPRGA